MKSKRLLKTAVIIAMGCLLIFVSFNDARGSDWVPYGKDVTDNTYFYDRESILNVSKGIIKVWTKKVYSTEGRAELIFGYMKDGVPASGYEFLSETKYREFINCVDEKYRMTNMTDYTSDGIVLDSFEEENSAWINVTPDSIVAILMKEVCKKTKESK